MEEFKTNLESEAFEEESEYEGVLSGAGEADSGPEGLVSGTVHISDEVISELAKKTLSTIEGVQPASPGIASKLGIGRKASEGVRVVLEDGIQPVATVDVYIMVKFGLRIPDLAWDVQEMIKEEYRGVHRLQGKGGQRQRPGDILQGEAGRARRRAGRGGFQGRRTGGGAREVHPARS